VDDAMVRCPTVLSWRQPGWCSLRSLPC